MKPADVCIAVLVAVIWGLAFVASRIALSEFSPELMTTLRFAIAAVPCLFVKKPDVSWPLLIAISLTLFLGQFLSQAFAIAHGVPVGLSSVIVQSQALFTIGFAALLFAELPSRTQTVGIGIATLGLVMICGTVGYDFSVAAFAILMVSPLSFAAGNLLLRRAQDVAVPRRRDSPRCADLGQQRAAADLAGADAHVADRSRLRVGTRLDLDQHRLLVMGSAAAGLSRSTGGAVCAVGAVRWVRRLKCRVRRNLWFAAPCRHGHRGRRHCRHAAGEARLLQNSSAKDRVRAGCHTRF
jgi:uncharacterized membrane protein